MATVTHSLHEVSRFHEMVMCLHLGHDQPTIAVQSSDEEWKADVHIADSAVLSGELESLDRLSIEEWLSLYRDELLDAWDQIAQGHYAGPIEGLPEDWPLGGAPPTRPLCVRPLEAYRLWVEWEDGSAREVDLGYLADHPAFAGWRDPAVFQSVKIDGSHFTWGEGMEVCAWLECRPTQLASPQEALNSNNRGCFPSEKE